MLGTGSLDILCLGLFGGLWGGDPCRSLPAGNIPLLSIQKCFISAVCLGFGGIKGKNGGLGNSDEDLGEQSPLSLPHSLEDSRASLGCGGDELCPHIEFWLPGATNCPWHTRAVPVAPEQGDGLSHWGHPSSCLGGTEGCHLETIRRV